MYLKDSTLAAVEAMDRWANYIEVYNYMIENSYFIGNSKTPEKSVRSELYKHAEKGIIDKKKDGVLPLYKKK